MPEEFLKEINHLLSKKETEKIAVIDIGSNSVRLVVYDGLKRSPLPLFNEKVLCGLAKEMGKTGKLNPKGAEQANKAIGRFAIMAKSLGVKNITAIATSAVRDATDGKLFRDNIENKYGLKIRVISGEEEARFSTLGVLASIFAVNGIVGDLGGGSIEFSHVKSEKEKYKAEGFISLPLGPLRINGNREKAEKIIDENFKNLELFKQHKGKNFYAVGGGFRALAKIHIDKNKYPLRVLHNYGVSAKDMLATAAAISRMPPSKIKSLHAIPESRAQTLSITALIARKIIEHMKPEKFVFSVHGLREGFLFDKLSDEIKEHDSLISGCCDMMKHIAPAGSGNEWTKFGYEVFSWMGDLFKEEKPQFKKLRLAASILSRVAWSEHTEYRAEMAFRTILDSTLSGINHAERAFLATSVYHRYKTNPDLSVTSQIQKIISRELVARARIIGLGLRLGLMLSGGALDVLPKTKLKCERGYLILDVAGEYKYLIGENVERRLEKLADAIGLETKIKS